MNLDMRRQLGRIAVSVVVTLAAALILVACGSSESVDRSDGDGGFVPIRDRAELEVYDNEHTTDGQVHLPVGETGEYTVIPPYGEEHSPIPLACGIYSATPTFEMVVHAMEHGAVVLWYAPTELSDDQLASLTDISAEHLNDSEYVIQAPYGALGAPIMLVAWGARLALAGVEARAIEQFFDEFHDDAPEPLAAGGCATAG